MAATLFQYRTRIERVHFFNHSQLREVTPAKGFSEKDQLQEAKQQTKENTNI